MPKIPAFSLNHSFSADQAWHDKIEWGFIPAALFDPDEEEVGAFMHSLSCPDTNATEQNVSGAFGWLLTPQNSRRARYSRGFRGSRLRWGDLDIGKPLLTGKLKLDRESESRLLQFWLNVNPTRWTHHHPDAASDPPEIWRNSEILSSLSPPSTFAGEYSLDGNDNWIPQTRLYRSSRRRPSASSTDYLRVIEEAIVSELERAAGINSSPLIFLQDPRYTLQRIETYWEFEDADPTRLVATLKRPLKAFSRGTFRGTAYPTGDGDWDRNSLSINVPLARGESLTVYAKTNRRVRFEVRLDSEAHPDSWGGGRQVSNMSRLERRLRAVREHGAAKLNNLFEFLRGYYGPVENPISPSQFLKDLSGAVQQPANFATVLSLLLENDKLENVPGLGSEIIALKRAGIISSMGPKRRCNYQVASCYRQALARLRGKVLTSSLGARDR